MISWFNSCVAQNTPKSSSADALWAISARARRNIEAGFRAEYMNLCGSFMGPIMDSMLNNKDVGDLTVTAAVSNGGLAPKVDGYGPWKLVRVRPVVNSAYARYPTILIETAAGHLTVTLLCPTQYIADEDADALLDGIMRALGTLIGGGKIGKDASGLVTTLEM